MTESAEARVLLPDTPASLNLSSNLQAYSVGEFGETRMKGTRLPRFRGSRIWGSRAGGCPEPSQTCIPVWRESGVVALRYTW
jgi:hypothetical protein